MVTPSNQSDSAAAATISTVLYKSRALIRPTDTEMDGLLARARERNRKIGVTGMLLYEDDCFFQWLEGPGDAVGKLWRAINADPRHGDIELVSWGVSPSRLFAKWDMQFLHRRGRAAASASPRPVQPDDAAATIRDLARLAIDGKIDDIVTMLRGQKKADPGLAFLCRRFFEPIARCLGDWWMDDRCSELQVTLALWTLQSALRRLGGEADIPAPLKQVRRLLTAPPPGEPHGLGSMLVGDLFYQAGWVVQQAFPVSDRGVADLVHQDWFDLLSLSLSDVHVRRDRLDAVAATIRLARAASCNRTLLVAVGGRACTGDQATLLQSVGADIVYPSASEAVGRSNFSLAIQEPNREHRAAAPAPKTPIPISRVIVPESLPPGWFWLRDPAETKVLM